MSDPSTDTWHETMGLSTAKQLRETQTALSASQADLTRVEAERDQANDLTDKIAAELRLVTRERDSLARRCAVRFEETQALQAERDALTVLNAELKAEAADFRAANERNLERLDRTQREVARANHRNRILTAENEAALRRLNEAAEQAEKLRGYWQECSRHRDQVLAERDWRVAHQDTGITCSSCARPIVRGQAFQPLADAKGFFAHAACPLKEA